MILAVVIKSAKLLTVCVPGSSYRYNTPGDIVIASLHLIVNCILVDEAVQLYTSSPPGQAVPLTALSTSELAANAVGPIMNYREINTDISDVYSIKLRSYFDLGPGAQSVRLFQTMKTQLETSSLLKSEPGFNPGFSASCKHGFTHYEPRLQIALWRESFFVKNTVKYAACIGYNYHCRRPCMQQPLLVHKPHSV